MPKSNYYFSSLRLGMAAYTKSSGAAGSRKVNLTLRTTADLANGGRESKERTRHLTLYGPGDITEIDDKKIISGCIPRDGATGFSPLHVPALEFHEPDFPWRYSEETGADGHLLPWLTLIVLEAPHGLQAGEYAEIDDQDRPERGRWIEVKSGAILPDLATAGRWAHVQYTDRAGRAPKDVEARLREDPRRGTARLLAPRRLKPGYKYTAFLVPVYQATVDAVVGQPKGAGDASRKCWNQTEVTANFSLPFFARWSFFTRAREADFEAMVKKIKPHSLHNAKGVAVSTQNPGYLVSDREERTLLPSALVPVDAQPTETETNSTDLRALLAKALRPTQSNEDPLVLPPVYGRYYLPEAGSNFALGASGWPADLNLRLSYRLMAGFGAEIIRQKQEELLEEAWLQWSRLREENRILNRSRFSIAVGRTLHRRLGNFSKAEVDPKTVYHFLRVTAGTRAVISAPKTTPGSSMMRTGKNPDLTVRGKFAFFQRKLGATTGKDWVHLAGGQTDQPIRPGGIQWARGHASTRSSATAPDLTEAAKEAYHALAPEKTIALPRGQRVHPLREWSRRHRPGTDTEEETDVRDLSPVLWHPEFHRPTYELLRDLSPDLLIPGIEAMPPNSVSLCRVNHAFVEAFLLGLNHEFAGELRWREFPTDLRGSYFRNFWDASVLSVSKEDVKAFHKSPLGTQTGEELLANFREYLTTASSESKALETAEKLRRKAELTEVENQVLDHYIAGFEDWLLTREENKDVIPLHEWKPGTSLGDHGPKGATEGEQLVLLLRAELFEVYPNLLIYLAPWRPTGTDFRETERRYPVLAGTLPPDVEFVGFPPIPAEKHGDFSIVFEERPGAQRFGLDLTADGGDADDLAWSHFGVRPGEYLDSRPIVDNEAAAGWPKPAYIAKVMTQRPVRYAIPLRDFLTSPNT